ncbi:hypothetical protein AGMMS49587_13340 [Spirochaetia bacterium]|nr:hypothetical protein AGMMS49587_13340 [Spirochaetia bacterium]
MYYYNINANIVPRIRRVGLFSVKPQDMSEISGNSGEISLPWPGAGGVLTSLCFKIETKGDAGTLRIT